MINPDFSFFSLGGIGEIGLNCYILTVSGESYIIDMGIDFAEHNCAGLGVMLPDLSVLKKHSIEPTAIIFTHGHDDHIGAFTYYSEMLNLPVYASPFVAEYIKQKLNENEKPPVKEIRYISGDNAKIKIGKTYFNFFHTKHSIPQSYGFYVDTPLGQIVFTSDFKGIPNIKELPKKPFILFSDSTNVEEDSDVDEDEVDRNISKIFEDAEGAIIATTFSSNIDRIQKIIALSEKYDKSLFIVGKNIENAVSIAKKLGILYISNLNHWDEIKKIPRNKIVVITTGSQGEKFSSLSLISKGNYKGFEIEKGDTIILSSSIIPGNEVNIYNMINRFSEKEVNVFHSKISKIHSSGHGSKKVLKSLITELKPENIVPIHGEARHLQAFKQLAISLGYDEEKVILLKNGEVIEATGDGRVKTSKKIELNKTFLDDDGGYELDTTAIKERKKISANGVVLANVNIASGFDIKFQFYGLIKESEKNTFEKELLTEVKKNIILDYLRSEGDYKGLKESITQIIKTYIKKQLSKKPMVITNILEGKCF